MSKKYGQLLVAVYNADDKCTGRMSRASIEPAKDLSDIYRTLEFRDASRRDGRLFVCALVPKWKRVFLKLLKIEVLK